MAGRRQLRLEELIKRIIGDFLVKGEVKDPRIGFVTIYKVELNDDYTLATVYVSVIGKTKEKFDSLKGLNAAAGYIKFHMSKELKLRTIPDVLFKLDDSIEKGIDIVNLIDSVQPKNQPEEE